MSTVKETLVTRSAVEALSAELQEPQWLLQRRLAAFATYAELPLPTRADEAWRRTDLSGLDIEAIRPFVPAAPVSDPTELPPAVAGGLDDAAGGTLVQIDATTVYRHLRAELAAQGVVFTDLTTAAWEQPELIEKLFMQGSAQTGESKFTALHAAFASGGTILYVPKGVEVSVPLQAVVHAKTPNSGLFNHTLIVAEENSRVRYVERLSAEPAATGVLHSGVVEVIARPGSQVTYCSLQDWGGQVRSFSVRRAWIDRDARVDWVAGEFGGELVRSELTSHLVGQGSASNIYLVYFADGTQHMDIGAGLVHHGSWSEGDILGRGVLNHRARSVFRGVGQINHGAASCKTFQRTQALVLDRAARADTIPGLIIDEHDVLQGGHAATVGQVDKEQLFYMMSRGLSRRAALGLLIEGFVRPVLDRIPLAAVRTQVEQMIARKMGAV